MPRCVECGYLAFRKQGSRDLVEAEDAYRRSETRGSWLQGNHVFFPDPICFARAVHLEREINNCRGWSPDEAHAGVVAEERTCSAYTPWQQGFSPKEHREMLVAQQMLEAQREQQQLDREWREHQAAEDRAWKSRETWYRRVEILSVIVLAPLMAWLIPWLGQRYLPPPATPAPTSAPALTPPQPAPALPILP